MAHPADDIGPKTAEGAIVPSGGQAAATAALLAPRSGRTVRLSLSLGQERLEILGPQGATELSVVLTENGPKLVFESADVHIVAANGVAVDCRTFEVRAKEELKLAGASTTIEARAGDVTMTANDCVSLVGEQIRLNCDGPDEVPPWMQRELAAQLDSTTTSSPDRRREHRPTAQPARADTPALVPRRDQTGDLAGEDPGEAAGPEQQR